nr:hypothetical protein [Tanacetum cinerariifolium]
MINGDAWVKDGIFIPEWVKIRRNNGKREISDKDPYNICQKMGVIILNWKDIPNSRGHRHSWNRKACFVCKSFRFLIKDCDYYEKKMVQQPVRNHAMRGNHQHYARMTHPNPHRHVVPTTFLTRSRRVPLNAARPVTTVIPPNKVHHQRPTTHGVLKAHSPSRMTIHLRPSPTHSNFY